MLRQVCKPLQFVKIRYSITRKKSDYSRPMELNQVQLLGTIEDEVQRLRNNALRFHVRTRNLNDDGFCIHKVSVVNKQLLEKLSGTLGANQGIYIGGRLKSESTKSAKGWIYESEILANELYYLDENRESTQNIRLPVKCEQNNVKFLSFIASNIYNDPEYSSFCILNHFKTKKISGDDNFEFHEVRISKSHPLHKCVTNLKRYDRIYLEGHLDYLTIQSQEDDNVTTAFISPNFLTKLKRIQQKNSPKDETEDIIDKFD